jgi:non-ribosomal peptide synthetase component E (peptide arylation enzyme)
MPEPPAAVGRPNFLLLHAQNRPDRLAVVGLERSLTHAQLLERARALARALHSPIS